MKKGYVFYLKNNNHTCIGTYSSYREAESIVDCIASKIGAKCSYGSFETKTGIIYTTDILNLHLPTNSIIL